MNFQFPPQYLNTVPQYIALFASLLASLWSFFKLRRAKRIIVEATGDHRPRVRWIVLAFGCAACALFFATITVAAHVSGLDADRKLRMIGLVTSVTDAEDGRTVVRLRDLTGEVPVLFHDRSPEKGDFIYVEGIISMTPQSRSPFLIAAGRSISISTPFHQTQ
jgi:hypothetical protein